MNISILVLTNNDKHKPLVKDLLSGNEKFFVRFAEDSKVFSKHMESNLPDLALVCIDSPKLPKWLNTIVTDYPQVIFGLLATGKKPAPVVFQSHPNIFDSIHIEDSDGLLKLIQQMQVIKNARISKSISNKINTLTSSQAAGNGLSQLFRKLIDRSNDLIFIIDPDTALFLDVNQTACNTLGYSKEELLSMTVMDIESKISDISQWHHRVEQILKGNYYFEGLQKRKNGSTYYIELNSNLLTYVNLQYIVSIGRDITQRIKSEAQVRQLLQAVEQSPSSIIVTDKNGTIEYVNPHFCTVSGWSSGEAIGKNPRFLKSGLQSKEFYKNLWETILAGEIWRGEFQNRKKNGELTWESVSISPIKDEDGKITHFVAVKEDITQKKKSEEELRIKEEQYRLVAEFTYNWEYWLDPQENYVFVSPSCVKISGYKSSEFKERPALFFDIIHPDDKKNVVRHFKVDIPAKTQQPIVFRLIDRSGKIKWIQHISVPVYNSDGEWMGTRGTNRDITEQKKIEEIEQKAETLKTMQELAGAISHEFSQPLQALNNYINLIKIQPNNPDNIIKSIENIKRISLLVDNLRDLTSIQHQDYVSGKIIDLKHSSQDAMNGNSPKILVVDDEPPIRETLVEMFNISGYACDGASGGLEALNMLNKTKYNIIFSDISMPGMSGLTLFEKIKSINYKCYFVFMTGYTIDGDMDNTVKQADALVHKPVEFETILALVEKFSSAQKS